MFHTLQPITEKDINFTAIPKDFDRAKILFEQTFPVFGRSLNIEQIVSLYATSDEAKGYISQERKRELVDYHQKLKDKWENNFQLWFESVDIPFAKKEQRPYINGIMKNFLYYEDVSRVVEAVLSAKYGMPYSLKFDNLVAVHNYVLQYTPDYYYQFIGVAKYYGHQHELYPSDPIRAKEWQDRVAKAKDKTLSTNHTLNKLITFLCPALDNRLFDWQYQSVNPKPFNSFIFYKNLLSDHPTIDENLISQHTTEIIDCLRHYTNSHLEHLLPISTDTLNLILDLLKKHYVLSSSHFNFYSRHSLDWEQQECDEFAILLDFLQLNTYISEGMYDSNSNTFSLKFDNEFEQLDEEKKYELEDKFSYLMNIVLTQYDDFKGSVGHGRMGLPSLLWDEISPQD